jgi:hypothetical protein
VPVTVAVPPYLLRGVINYKSRRDFYNSRSHLAQFFPLLTASLSIDEELIEERPVILVNRDAVLAFGIPGSEELVRVA